MGGDPVLITLSKTTKIAELKIMIKEKMEVGGQQTLYYRGKPLDDENTVFDYDVKLNDIIQMMVRPPLADSQADNLPNIKQKTKEKKKVCYCDNIRGRDHDSNDSINAGLRTGAIASRLYFTHTPYT